jgi:ribonuclease HI
MVGQVSIYTDGSCHRKRGSCAYVVVRGDSIIQSASQVYVDTTSNRMELRAVIHGLDWVNKYLTAFAPCIYTDSQYVANMPRWIKSWQARGWYTQSGQPVANTDLIYLLHKTMQASAHAVEFVWVAGHRGDRWNEHAHRLAETAVNSPKKAGVPDHDLDLLTCATAWATYPQEAY